MTARGGGRCTAFTVLVASCIALACSTMPLRVGAQGPDAATNDRSSSPLARLLDEARSQMAAGNADGAWRMLEERVADYAGNADFDYLLGLAALDSGRPGRAVFALERVLINRPDFLQARAEIARAYFELRERDNARREFETIASQRIPDEVRQLIGRYLDAIARDEAAARPTLSGFVELEAGYDSNVNFGSASNQWVLADGTAVTPIGISLPRSSSVFSGTLGLNWLSPMDGGWQWTVGGRASTRIFPSAHTLDQHQFDLSAGVGYRTGCHRLTMLAQLQHLRLDSDAFRNAAGAVLQWQCDLDARTQVGAYLQGFELSFPGESARDARRTGLGLTAARVLEGAARPILIGGLHFGEESSKRGFDNLSHRYRGLRLAFSMGLGGGWRGFSTIAWERRDFGAIEPLFGAVRDDRQLDLRVGAERALTTHWVVAPTFVHTRNRSTLAPNDFRRSQASLIFRYRF